MPFTALFTGQQRAAPRSYSLDSGWSAQRQADGTVHTGYYRAVGRTWQGWIYEGRKGKLECFIFQPPIELIRATEFAGCFHARGDDWWLITFKPSAKPDGVDSGIAAIQKTLFKAFQQQLPRRRR